MSFREEIELFYDAEIIVGAHGSGLANLVFSDNMSVVDIFPTKCVISHVLRIRKMLDHSYYPGLGQGDDRCPELFVVDVDEVIAAVEG